MRLYAVPGGLVNVKRPYNESKFFRFTVQTTGPSETFALPLEAVGTYDFCVDWGDDSSDNITTWNDAAVTHTYASAGTHTISISGIIQGWKFDNGGNRLKLYDIKSWGPLRLGNSGGYFYGCSNLTVSAIDTLDTSSVTTFYYAFRDCSSLTTLDVSAWDTSSVTSFYYAFKGCSSLTTLAANNWDITSVTTMENMLFGVTLTTTNYSDILVAFEAQAVLDNVPLHGGNSQYSAGAAATARAALITDHAWTITDNGQEP